MRSSLSPHHQDNQCPPLHSVKVTGKVVYVTATLPLVLLLIFTIRACTLPGADTGLQYFFTPKWEEMLKPKVLQ